jgi:ABC-type lipoprotein release transport system permease subunit
MAGAALGVVGALVAGRFIRGLLFGVSTVDATAYLITIGLVLAVALLTSLLPATRAARTDPVEALAGE